MLNHVVKCMYKQKHFIAHLQDLIPTLAGIKYISDNTSQSRD